MIIIIKGKGAGDQDLGGRLGLPLRGGRVSDEDGRKVSMAMQSSQRWEEVEDKDQEKDKFDIEENLQVAEAAVRWLGAPIVGVTIILLPVTGDDERYHGCC